MLVFSDKGINDYDLSLDFYEKLLHDSNRKASAKTKKTSIMDQKHLLNQLVSGEDGMLP